MKYFFAYIFCLSLFAKIEVQGHRGARAVLPENTIPAFEYALEVGVDVIELDLAITKDNKVVVAHDLSINTEICEYTKENVFINSLNLKQLKNIDCGNKANKNFPKQKSIPDTKMPTLHEVFQLVKNSKHQSAKQVMFNIEIKISPYQPLATPSPQKFAKLVYEVVKQNEMIERTIIQSFDYRPLREIKNLNKNIKTSFLSYGSLPDFVMLAKAINADIISPHYKWITKTEVNRLRAAGIKTVSWTANTEEQWQHLIDLGVDGIITDDPKALIEFLKSKKLR